MQYWKEDKIMLHNYGDKHKPDATLPFSLHGLIVKYPIGFVHRKSDEVLFMLL